MYGAVEAVLGAAATRVWADDGRSRRPGRAGWKIVFAISVFRENGPEFQCADQDSAGELQYRSGGPY